jgi:hypothetical protein
VIPNPLGSTVFQTIFLNKIKKRLSPLSLFSPSPFPRPEDGSAGNLLLIFLHFLTKQTNNHFNHTQNPTARTIGNKK